MSLSIQQILVHVDASAGCRSRLWVARQLARQQEAALSALYATVPVFTGLPSWPEAAPNLAESLIAVDNDRRDRARKLFDEMLGSASGATWSETPDMAVVGAVAAQAFYADLLVLGQRDPDDAQAAGVPAGFPESVMVASGKPAIVVPHVGAADGMGEVVAIAWKPTREAARAVAAAMPLLKKARQVHVLTWEDEEAPTIVQGTPLDLEGYLRVHRVPSTWHRGGPEPEYLGEFLLSRTFDLGADLLVMGCYGHSRAREWLLGGTSRAVLDSMTLPVLMAH